MFIIEIKELVSTVWIFSYLTDVNPCRSLFSFVGTCIALVRWETIVEIFALGQKTKSEEDLLLSCPLVSFCISGFIDVFENGRKNETGQ